MIPILTTHSQQLRTFIDAHQLIPCLTPPDEPVFFAYDGRDLFLCAHYQRYCLNSDALIPKRITAHPLHKIIKKNQHIHPIIDTTGGLGKDSLIALLSTPHTVITYERHPILFCALSWIHQQCRENRWIIRHQDARTHVDPGGLWLVDPMFPAHPKTAKSSAHMQIVQHLVPHTPDEEPELFAHIKKHATQAWVKQPAHKAMGLWGLWSPL